MKDERANMDGNDQEIKPIHLYPIIFPILWGYNLLIASRRLISLEVFK